MTKKVTKLLYAKRVRFKSGNRKDYQAPALEVLLDQLRRLHFRDLHHPQPPDAPGTIAAGTHCLFMWNVQRRPGRGADAGIYFQVGAYVHGSQSDQIAIDFEQQSPNVITGPIIDQHGQRRDQLHVYRCVALGETLLVENQRGSGGLAGLRKLLSVLFHRYGPDNTPGIELLDVASPDLRAAIERGGGAKRVMLRMIDSAANAQDNFLTPMHAIRSSIKGTRQLGVEWATEDGSGLDTDDVVNAAEELGEEGSPIDQIKIELRNDSTISRLGSYRLRHPIQVTEDAAGVLHTGEITAGLWSYLDELRLDDDRGRVINDFGYFNQSTMVTISTE